MATQHQHRPIDVHFPTAQGEDRGGKEAEVGGQILPGTEDRSNRLILDLRIAGRRVAKATSRIATTGTAELALLRLAVFSTEVLAKLGESLELGGDVSFLCIES